MEVGRDETERRDLTLASGAAGTAAGPAAAPPPAGEGTCPSCSTLVLPAFGAGDQGVYVCAGVGSAGQVLSSAQTALRMTGNVGTAWMTACAPTGTGSAGSG